MRVGIAGTRVRNGRGRGGHGRLARGTALGGALAIGAAGCAATGLLGGDAEEKPAATVSVSLPHGASDVRPDAPLVVKAGDGTLQDVTVATQGDEVEGDLNADRTAWTARWTLDPKTRYTVRATALGADGRTQTTTSEFSTLKAERTVKAKLEAPFDDEKVGVGIPIVLRFDRKVTNRAAVEKALQVRASKPAEGAWHWFEDGRQLVFRTKQFWPAHTEVRLSANLSGVEAAKDTYGTQKLSLGFRIGDKQVSKASARTKKMRFYKNDELKRTIPVSMGDASQHKYTTTSGMHLTMEKASPVIMDSSTVGCPPGCPDYYRQTVYKAVRVSNSGEYVHSAPWSVGSQGNANVSHGCINLSPANAGWFYKRSQRGDPYLVKGTKRKLEPTNGWGYWQLSWNKWLKGSALGQPVKVGPSAATETAGS